MKKIHINEPKSYKGHSLILLLLLNIFDGLITYIGLEFGFYQEMNVLVNNIYNYSSNLFLLIKVIIPTAILILLALNIKLLPSQFSSSFLSLVFSKSKYTITADNIRTGKTKIQKFNIYIKSTTS